MAVSPLLGRRDRGTDPGRPPAGQGATEQDWAQERGSVTDLREAIAHAEGIRDFVSRDLCQDILESEEEHVDWLETQLDLIGQMGLPNFIQRAAGGIS